MFDVYLDVPCIADPPCGYSPPRPHISCSSTPNTRASASTPLRSPQLKGLQDAIELLANAAPRFMAALMVLFLLLYVAATTGVNLFGGALHNRCYSQTTGILLPESTPHRFVDYFLSSDSSEFLSYSESQALCIIP